MEAAVDRLIAAMDALDAPEEDIEYQGDEELDHDGEASLGARENCASQTIAWGMLDSAVHLQDDCELDDSDTEPSLGFLEHHPSCGWGMWDFTRSPSGDQSRLCEGDRRDLEDEHDGREPDDEGDGTIDDEPSLGATNDTDQSRWGASGVRDLEVDAGDELEAVNEDGDESDGDREPDESTPLVDWPCTEVLQVRH